MSTIKDATFERILSKVNIPQDTLEAEYQKLYDSTNAKLPDVNRMQGASFQLLKAHEAELKYDLREYQLVVLNDSGIKDTVEYQWRIALKKYNEDPAGAIKEGLVNEKGEPIQPKMSFGKVNKLAGSPLPRHKYSRTFTGFAGAFRPDGSVEAPEEFVIYANEQQSKCELPLYQSIKISAQNNGKNTQNMNILKLPDESNYKYENLENNGVNIEMLVKQMYPTKTYSQIFEAIIAIDPKTARKTGKIKRVSIEGFAERIKFEPNDKGNRIVNVNMMDEKFNSLMVLVPEHVDIDFAENSKVLVTGDVTQFDPDERNPDGKLMLTASSIYAIPEFKVPINKNVKSIKDDAFNSDEF